MVIFTHFKRWQITNKSQFLVLMSRVTSHFKTKVLKILNRIMNSCNITAGHQNMKLKQILYSQIAQSWPENIVQLDSPFSLQPRLLQVLLYNQGFWTTCFSAESFLPRCGITSWSGAQFKNSKIVSVCFLLSSILSWTLLHVMNMQAVSASSRAFNS